MAVSKLASADKAEIVRLYRETPASLSQLAKQFGISISTVSRFLQEAIPPEEYRQLVSYKQSHRPRRSAVRKVEEPQPTQLELVSPPPVEPVTAELVEEIAQELAGIDDEFEIENLDEEEEDLEETGEGEDFAPTPDLLGIVNPLEEVQVRPFSEAVLPELCYMIVDKAHEIVTRPLQAFKDLGKIPEAELQSVTVPIFDNHRVVRRFCRPHQLIIKFPGELLAATRYKLLQKGITRLLIGGQVYALP